MQMPVMRAAIERELVARRRRDRRRRRPRRAREDGVRDAGRDRHWAPNSTARRVRGRSRRAAASSSKSRTMRRFVRSAGTAVCATMASRSTIRQRGPRSRSGARPRCVRAARDDDRRAVVARCAARTRRICARSTKRGSRRCAASTRMRRDRRECIVRGWACSSFPGRTARTRRRARCEAVGLATRPRALEDGAGAMRAATTRSCCPAVRATRIACAPVRSPRTTR